MRLSFGLMAIGLVSISLQSACGKWAKASPEAVTTMPRPTFPTVENDVFSLNSPKAYTSYKGTMVIFSHDASVKDTAELINASVDSRLKWAESKKFQDDTNYNATFGDENASAKNTLKLMKDGLQKFDLEALSKNPIDPASRLANSKTIVERELSLLNLSVEKRAAFDESWAHYCEAKIIEFAAHPMLAQNSFKSKPSPAAVCDDYYASKQMMTGPDCDSASGDYLKCVWLDGVAKTRWFTSPNETSDSEIARLKAEKRSKLTELFNEANYESTKGVLGFVESAYTSNAAYKKLYFDKKDSMLNIAVRQTNDTRCAKAIVNTVTQGYCTIFGISAEKFSPKQVIDAMEGVSSAAAIVSDLPTPTDRNFTLQQLLQYLNKRNGVETSESDRLFLELKDGSSFAAPTFAKYGAAFANLVPEIRTAVGADFYGSFSKADLEARAFKVAAIQAQQARIDENNAEYLRYLEAASAGSDRGAAAANRPGFSKGFVSYELVLRQLNNVLSLELTFADQTQYTYRACLDLSSYENADCPAGFTLKEDVSYLPAKINWSKDGGKIDLSFQLQNVDAIGFGLKERKPASEKPSFFMDLPASETEGKTLHFELYRNRILGALDIMTGKAFIEDGDKQLWEAGISIWENVD